MVLKQKYRRTYLCFVDSEQGILRVDDSEKSPMFCLNDVCRILKLNIDEVRLKLNPYGIKTVYLPAAELYCDAYDCSGFLMLYPDESEWINKVVKIDSMYSWSACAEVDFIDEYDLFFCVSLATVAEHPLLDWYYDEIKPALNGFWYTTPHYLDENEFLCATINPPKEPNTPIDLDSVDGRMNTDGDDKQNFGSIEHLSNQKNEGRYAD